MLGDARTLGDGAELSADVCILGAGAAGITLARRLSGKGMRVVLLESGSFEIEPQHQALYAGVMSGIDTWSLDDHRWRLFGGSTARWAGWCMPLLPGDFAARDHIPDSGWPLGFDDLAPYYARAHDDLELGPFEYGAEALAAADGMPLIHGSGRLETHVFRFSPPTRMGTRYRAELGAAEDVDVWMWANAVDLVLDDALARIDHVACATLSGVRFTVSAGRYVLAMGGLENARLLLASRSQVEGGVASSSGLVGATFMEHPHMGSAAAWIEPGVLDERFYVSHPTRPGDVEVRGALALSEETRAAEGLPHLTLTVEEAPVDDAATGSVPAAAVAALSGRPQSARLFTLSLRAEQTPNRESVVALSDERDALGVPRLDLHWAVSGDDLRAYARALDILGAELGAAGLGRVWAPLDGEGRLARAIRPGGHHMGTVRMHVDPARGVVDGDGRAHDVDNLYVAGSAVFTTGGAANPTLTIVALAERMADHLAGEPS
jgi:choline dehydrogenase-like flavoprotein